MSEVLIRAENVGKKFCRDLKKSLWYGVKDSASEVIGRRSRSEGLRTEEFWANSSISFQLQKGECLGLVGRNGAGKTTLLKMLNGLIKPDSGFIEMRGRVAALIALGAGFNPVLTGRENIWVNGSILGLSRRQINDRMEHIVDFAEISNALDSPVRTYSSGMNVRLGFAVAAILIESEVLLLDEVLAVGDIAFRVRCYNRIKEMLPTKAVVFVSHGMFDVSRVCTSVLVLDGGSPVFCGTVDKGIQCYNKMNKKDVSTDMVAYSISGISSPSLDIWERRSDGLEASLGFVLSFSSEINLRSERIRVVFFDEMEIPVAEWDSVLHGIHFDVVPGRNSFNVHVKQIRLRSGVYRVAVVLTGAANTGYTMNIDHAFDLVVESLAVAGAAYKI